MNAHEDEANELMDLTKLIRANLDLSSQMFVTLATELEFVKRYVGIERRMVKDEFEFTMQIAPDVAMDEIVIPSMLVQILVENAFVHGLRGWEGKKRLTISVQRKQTGGTVISVVDNGKGFDIRNKGKKRVGLGVVTQTIAIINEHSRDKMTFSLRNLQGEKQEVLGCQAMVYVPDGIKSNI